MLSFSSDYTKGAHPEILKRLVETNLEPLPGYEQDKYCLAAANKIKEIFNCKNGDVYFVSGGTQANQVIIASMLKDYEGVISATTGHINVHEAGAIEYTGHKVLPLLSKNGKLEAKTVRKYLKDFYNEGTHEHMVFPGMIYVSFPTEYGTLYSKKELKDLHNICKKYKMPFFIDGARLGYGLMSLENDIKIEEFASLCDMFYVGGTKVGALCGEAIVFTHNNAPKHFITQIKEHGAMLAKGRLLGVQFDTLFTNNLYFNISKHAINMAHEIKNIFVKKEYKLFIDSPTNQQFIILPNTIVEKLQKMGVDFSIWEKYDANNTVVRFASSWSTELSEIKELEKLL